MTEPESAPKVRAQWVGPYGDRLPDGTVLSTDTICEIGHHEAHASDNWKVLGPVQTDEKPKAKAKADTEGGES